MKRFDFSNEAFYDNHTHRLFTDKPYVSVKDFAVNYYHGVRDAFDRDSADFSAMAANGAKRGNDALYVDQVLQSATIKVNEEGTEAAAATGVLLGAMGLPSYVNLTIDRPFVYFVRENTTGQIVFIGRTVKPTFDPDDPDMKTPEVEPGSRVMPMGMGGMSGGMGGMGIVPGAGM